MSLLLASDAVISAVPQPTPFTSPVDDTVATVSSLEVHVIVLFPSTGVTKLIFTE